MVDALVVAIMLAQDATMHVRAVIVAAVYVLTVPENA